MSKIKFPRPKHVLDNRSNQLNPQHPEYYRSRGITPSLAQSLAAREQKPSPPEKQAHTQSLKTTPTK